MCRIKRRCRYCGQNLSSEYIINLGSCFYCDNPKCSVKPITEYNLASSEAFIAELNEITLDKIIINKIEE